MQQGVLALWLAGASIRAAGRQGLMSRRTLGRWWGWLRGCVALHGFHLRSLAPWLGRAGPGVEVWSAALGRAPLWAWMASLDRLGVAVP